MDTIKNVVEVGTLTILDGFESNGRYYAVAGEDASGNILAVADGQKFDPESAVVFAPATMVTVAA